jgi:pimeloyl-ACP methyl ester carboxylesterase
VKERTRILTDSRGEGRPIVLVPGGLTGWQSWIPHQEILQKEYRVIRSQLFAVESGLHNEPLPKDYSVQWEVDALAEKIDELGLDKFDLASWSYGAAVSVSYAIHHPEKIRSLTLIEPPAIWILKSRGPLSESLERERLAIASLAPGPVTEEQLIWFTHFAGFVPMDVDPQTLPMWQSWSEHKQSLRNGDAVFWHNDDMDLVRSFPHPVLLIKGSGSSKFLHDIIDILSETFTKAKLVEFPGGHAPQIVSKEAFMTEFQRFIESVND